MGVQRHVHGLGWRLDNIVHAFLSCCFRGRAGIRPRLFSPLFDRGLLSYVSVLARCSEAVGPCILPSLPCICFVSGLGCFQNFGRLCLRYLCVMFVRSFICLSLSLSLCMRHRENVEHTLRFSRAMYWVRIT